MMEEILQVAHSVYRAGVNYDKFFSTGDFLGNASVGLSVNNFLVFEDIFVILF